MKNNKKFEKLHEAKSKLAKRPKNVLVKFFAIVLVIFFLGFACGFGVGSCAPALAEELDDPTKPKFGLINPASLQDFNIPITFQVSGDYKNSSSYGSWFPYKVDTPFDVSLSIFLDTTNYDSNSNKYTNRVTIDSLAFVNDYTPGDSSASSESYTGYMPFFENSALLPPEDYDYGKSRISWTFNSAFTKSFKRDWAVTVSDGAVAWNWFKIGATENFSGYIRSIEVGTETYAKRVSPYVPEFTASQITLFDTFYNWYFIKFNSTGGGYFYVVFECVSTYLSSMNNFIMSGVPDHLEILDEEIVEWENYTEGYYRGYEEGYDSGIIATDEEIYDEGVSDGYDVGFEEGKTEGFGQGYDKGYDNGLQQGTGKGYDQGYKEGTTYGFEAGEKVGYDKAISSNAPKWTTIGGFGEFVMSLLDIKLFGSFGLKELLAVGIGGAVLFFVLKVIKQ